MAGLNRSRGLDFLLSGNKIKEQAETESKSKQQRFKNLIQQFCL